METADMEHGKSVLDFTVDKQDDGRMLHDVLRSRFQVSRGFLRRLRAHGVAEVNGQQRRLCDRVKVGEVVRLWPGDPDEGGVTPEPIPLDVVYADAHLLVVNKPAGMVMHPVRSYTGGTLANAVAYYMAPECASVTVRPVNRLDAGTSGLVVFACHAHAHNMLSRDITRRRFRRWYVALVEGIVPETSGSEWTQFMAPIARVTGHPVKRWVAPNGQEAITRYHVVKTWSDLSLLELELVTGRTHQVRVHMAYMGHPLVGDELYGGPMHLARPALHATRLSLFHPITQELLRFDVPIPTDIANLIATQGP